MSKTHVVEPGECLSSIARKYGFVNWRIIWDAPDNADLKKKRPNPDVIYPGDEVAIPDNKPKEVSVGKGASVDTSLKPEKISLRLAVYIDPDDKGPKGRWELKVEGVEDPLKSDLPSDGTISVEIPAKANKAVLQLFLTGGNEPDETYKLALGHLDPASTVSGAQERLRRLGYECGEVDGILGVRTRSALLTFQEMNGLDATGKLDQPTVNKLVDEFEGGGAVEPGQFRARRSGQNRHTRPSGASPSGRSAPYCSCPHFEEFAPNDDAQDQAEVLSVNKGVKVPFGSFHGCLETKNFTDLGPDARERKIYCAHVGLMVSDATKGDPKHEALVSITHH
jgi:hypothetical protein